MRELHNKEKLESDKKGVESNVYLPIHASISISASASDSALTLTLQWPNNTWVKSDCDEE